MKKVGGVLAVCVAIGGCGSSPAKSNAPATASAACRALHGVSATRSARCLGGAQADWEAYAASQEDCAAYDRHVAEHQVEYVPAGWDACVAEFDGPCDKIPSNCVYEILHGLVADGQHCQDTEVCGTYSICIAIGNATCGEVCARAPNENEACGLHCDDSGTPCLDFPFCYFDLSCQDGICVKSKGTGAACGGGDPVPCSPVQHCTADPADSTSTGTCQPRVAGGPCHADNDCPGTEFCLAGSCAVRRVPGQSCADAASSCVSWTACDAGVCVPAGQPGLPCAPYPGASPEFVICATGTCSGTMCVANVNPGGSCQSTACVPGSSCDAATLTCVACPP